MQPTHPRTVALLALALCLAVLVAFWPCLEAGFVNYDDDKYVTANPRVQAGLTGEAVAWAFTAENETANWHPLTWLSHQLDVEFYGLDPAGHHLTNLLLHMANGALLLVLLVRLTGRPWLSAIAAGLFALHPLRVESVAWVSERKDVLSTLFWLLTTLAWVGWTRRGGAGRYVLTAVLLALGLMAKPMVVTLPFTLLLLDWWPLGRFDPTSTRRWETLGRLVLEKVPLLALALASAVVTFLVQRAGMAMEAGKDYDLGTRLANALHAYGAYLGKTFWPSGLAVYYPYDNSIPALVLLLAVVVLGGITYLAMRHALRRPWLPVGWLWYLGTLVPVIGLVQVGGQSMADRYTYVPSVGLVVALVWVVAETAGNPRNRRLLAAGALVVLVALGALTWRQTGRWHSTETLFTHAIEVTEGNFLAHNSLGATLADADRHEEAVHHFRRALAINPEHLKAHLNLARNLFEMGRREESVQEYGKLLARFPGHPEAHANLGSILGRMGRIPEARRHLEKALAANPDYAPAHNNMGLVLAISGDLPGARDRFLKVLALDPRNAMALANLAEVYLRLNRRGEARRTYERLLEVQPNHAKARRFLGRR